MSSSNLLTTMTFLPTVGAILILLIKVLRLNVHEKTFWGITVATSALPLALAANLWSQFDPNGGVQFVHHFTWIPEFNIEYFIER